MNMKKQNIVLSLFAITITSIAIGGVYSADIFANESDVKRSSVDISFIKPDGSVILKQGESTTFPFKITAPMNKELDLRIIVTEATNYPDERAPLEKVTFTNGLSVTYVSEFKQAAQIGNDQDAVRGSIPITVSASSNAEVGQRYLAISILVGNPTQHFIQTYVPIVIEK